MSKFESSNESKFIASAELAKGFTVIPNEIMNDMNLLGPNAFFVFAKILQYISNPNHVISIQGLATQLGVSKTRVSNGLNKLIEVGYIKRTPLKNGNLTNGYLYEVFSEKQNVDITNVNDNVNMNVSEKTNNDESVENTTSHRNPKNWDTENRDTNFCDTDFRYANKENNNNNYINKENEVVVGVEKETKLIELYKSFKIEKRFMPHTKKLLLEYANKFDLDVFEQVFIAASEESVSKKYAYMKQVFENLDKKNIVTLDDYQKDQAEFKNKKQNKKCLTFITTCIKLNIVAAIHNQLIHQLAAYRNVAQLGRALRSGRRGRVFESRHSDSSRISVRICEQILGRGGRAGLEFI